MTPQKIEGQDLDECSGGDESWSSMNDILYTEIVNKGRLKRSGGHSAAITMHREACAHVHTGKRETVHHCRWIRSLGAATDWECENWTVRSILSYLPGNLDDSHSNGRQRTYGAMLVIEHTRGAFQSWNTVSGRSYFHLHSRRADNLLSLESRPVGQRMEKIVTSQAQGQLGHRENCKLSKSLCHLI